MTYAIAKLIVRNPIAPIAAALVWVYTYLRYPSDLEGKGIAMFFLICFGSYFVAMFLVPRWHRERGDELFEHLHNFFAGHDLDGSNRLLGVCLKVDDWNMRLTPTGLALDGDQSVFLSTADENLKALYSLANNVSSQARRRAMERFASKFTVVTGSRLERVQ